MKNRRDLLITFAANHVQRSFRERFVHEALNKNGKLQSRICHTIKDVFDDSYRNGSCPFEPDEACIPITGSGVDSLEEYRWSDVQSAATSGFGLLVISTDGCKFYAETEHEYRCPSIIYSASK
jgi:hypothetical protein